MKAKWNGQVVAESKDITEVGGYVYFPRASVRMELLEASPKNAEDLQCPHGVQFYDVVSGDKRSERAAWPYEKPQPSMAKVDHFIGFWKDVGLE